MRPLHKLLTALLFAAMFGGTAGAAPMRPVHAPHAMVVSVHELASRAGVEIMQAGGNAVDAAVATGFALAVVHPQAGNLGGGGFMLVRMADGATHFIDYRQKAPAAATANMYLDAQGNVIENLSLVGYKAIGVLGSVAGLAFAQKKYGKLPLERVMAPAIKIAREGYALAWEDARDLEDADLARFPSLVASFSVTENSSSRETCSGSRSWRRPSSDSRRTRRLLSRRNSAPASGFGSEGRRADHG